ncbi:MAG: DUF4157 domain-containing protein [Thermoanaerobaculia bacterium]|nr:DUF4157 domain-containing protein [Thermoanaerobaculia bacterium]
MPMLTHVRQRLEPKGTEAARRGSQGSVGAATPATAQLAAQGELAQARPAVRDAAEMGERLATRPLAASPVQLDAEPDPTGLGAELKAGLEALSGRDLSPVRVHYDSPKPAQLNAKAYTQLPHIYVAPGEEDSVPHEGWHAAQQMAGDVQPTLDVAGTPVNDDPRLEAEADRMGARALTVQRKEVGGLRQGATRTTAVAQRVIQVADDADDRLVVALASLVGQPVLTALESSPFVVLVSNSAARQSESWRKTPRNRIDFEARAGAHTTRPGEVDFLVTINNRELGGLRLDPLRSQDPRSFEAPRPPASVGTGGLNRQVAEALAGIETVRRGGRVPTSSASSPAATESSSWSSFLATSGLELPPSLELLLLDHDAEDRFRPQSLFTPLPNSAPLPPPKDGLSLATVLLHEFGHVRRELGIESEVLDGAVDHRLQAPDARLLIDPAISEAVALGRIESPLWQAVRNKLNAMNGWLYHAKATLGDAPGHLHPAPPSQAAATEIERLIARAQLEVGLWLEYDVISTVEHPYAVSQNEPIRRYHGEEAPLEGGDDDLPPLLDLEEVLRPAPRNLDEVHGRMAAEAQRLAGGLPVTLALIWASYEAYRPRALASLAVVLE